MTDATRDEFMVSTIAGALRDEELVFVGVGTSGRAFTLAVGIPLVAARLAQLNHAPALDIYWGNLLSPDLSHVPAALTQDAITRWRGAYAPSDVGLKVDMLVRGEFDVSFESAAQVDRYGNLNITRIGAGDNPAVRLVGTLAQPEHLAFVKRPIIVCDLSPRVFVEKVDYITSFGFGDETRTRASLGYEANGPALVVTDLCVFDFTPDGRMRLRTMHPGVTLDDVRNRMSFEPDIADDLAETPAPSADMLRLIRGQIDPAGALLRA
ncbi:CoA-transferase subunit beta [Mycobacterium sp. NPDC003449]